MPQSPSIQFSDFLTIASIIVAVVVGVITWIVSWLIFRAQTSRKHLSYFMRMTEIISHEFSADKGRLEIRYNDEIVDRLVLLEVNIKNIGNVAVESARVTLNNQPGIYIIPGYFEDVPPGYDNLWSIERHDSEKSDICLAHINPGQVAKVRFVMDNLPTSLPDISCPMVGLSFTESKIDTFMPLFNAFIDAMIEATPLFRPLKLFRTR